MFKRELQWEKCYNVRDLGGLPLDHGGQTAFGAIIRADILSRLTSQGQQALTAYGVQTIIDLRGTREIVAEPYQLSALATAERPLYFNLPLEKEDPQIGALIEQAQNRADVYKIVLEHCSDDVVVIMRAIVAAPPGGIVLHCHAGKDRTGMVAALLLSLAGVSMAAIGADYAASQARLWPLYETVVAQAGGEEHVNPWLKPIATADMILQPFMHITEKYGSVATYLQQAGLAEAEIKRLKARLLNTTTGIN